MLFGKIGSSKKGIMICWLLILTVLFAGCSKVEQTGPASDGPIENSEEIPGSASPVEAELPAPKELVWTVEPVLLLQEAEELEQINYNTDPIAENGYWEFIGRPVNFSDNFTEDNSQLFGSHVKYQADAVAVEVNGCWSVFDYSGDPILTDIVTFGGTKDVSRYSSWIPSNLYSYYRIPSAQGRSRAPFGLFFGIFEMDGQAGSYWFYDSNSGGNTFERLHWTGVGGMPDQCRFTEKDGKLTASIINMDNGQVRHDGVLLHRNVYFCDNNCFYDPDGALLFEAKGTVPYGDVPFFVNGFYWSVDNGKYTFIDIRNNEPVTGYLYDKLKYFEDGYAPARRDGKWGFIDEKGKEVSPFIFDDVTVLNEGRTYVGIGGQYGIMDLVSSLEGIDCLDEAGIREAFETHRDVARSIAVPDGTLFAVLISAEDLRIRQAPALDGEVLGFALQNSIYTVFETAEADDYTWYRIGPDRWIAYTEDWVKELS